MNVVPDNQALADDYIWNQLLNDHNTDNSEMRKNRSGLNSHFSQRKGLPITDDVLKNWKDSEDKVPHLAELSKKYHCPPPGSAASERLFFRGKIDSAQSAYVKTREC